MVIYHNDYDKHKEIKGEVAGISSFSTCVEMLSFRRSIKSFMVTLNYGSFAFERT